MRTKLLSLLLLCVLLACSKDETPESPADDTNYYKLLAGEWSVPTSENRTFEVRFTTDSLFYEFGNGIKYSIVNFRYDKENNRYIGDAFKHGTATSYGYDNRPIIELYPDSLHILGRSSPGKPYIRKKEE